MTTTGMVTRAERIDAVDVARGLALLGIFLVNVRFFSEPFGSFLEMRPTGSLGDQIVHVFVQVVCLGKFYSLFSLLFGVGFALQRARVTTRTEPGRSWAWLYSRRLLFLLMAGVFHALFFWYGDILFTYAVAGFVLLACGSLKPRTLALLGVGVLAFSMLLSVGFAALNELGRVQQPRTSAQGEPAPTPADAGNTVEQDAPPSADATPDPDTPEHADPDASTATIEIAVPQGAPAGPTPGSFEATPFGRLIKGFQSGQVQQPDHPIWMQAETEAYRDGPYDQVFYFRALSWVFILIVTMFGFGWSVIGMMLLGAALAKGGLLGAVHAPFHRRLAIIGLSVGLACAGAASAIISTSSGTVPMMLYTLFQGLAGPLVALGILGGICVLVQARRARALTGLLACTGRMAFSNYLLQTLVATTTFYFYGLGLFGSFSRVEQTVFVLAVYACQLVFSGMWMRFFTMGPLEWVWRWWTYLARPALLRVG
jgi:uncharacterized protein